MKILKALAKIYIILASITGTIGFAMLIYVIVNPGYTWKPGDYISHGNT
jgi:hypothetical protein